MTLRRHRSRAAGAVQRRPLELLRRSRALSALVPDWATSSPVDDRPAPDRCRPGGRRPGQHHRRGDAGRTGRDRTGKRCHGGGERHGRVSDRVLPERVPAQDVRCDARRPDRLCVGGRRQAETPGGPTERTELLIVDTSGSMNGKKLRAVKAATAAAIDCIPDGVRFGVITGNHQASLAVEPTVASPESRGAAKDGREEVRGRRRHGHGYMDTAGGQHLRRRQPGIRHAILLTDGKNESEAPIDLDWALADADGAFQCDCRGVGDNWDVGELRKVATALRGTYDIVAEPEGLERDFSQMLQESLLRQVSEITLARVDATGCRGRRPQADGPAPRPHGDSGCRPVRWSASTPLARGATRAVTTTSVCGRPPAQVDDKMLAARVTLVVGGEPAGQGLVKADVDGRRLGSRPA